jgi:hypothetical protein
VLITVLVNGGGTYYLLTRWDLQSTSSQPRSQELAPMLARPRSSVDTPMGGGMVTADRSLAPASNSLTCGEFNSNMSGSRCVLTGCLYWCDVRGSLQVDQDSCAPALSVRCTALGQSMCRLGMQV